MDSKVVIDCIGPSVLTITIGGAAHSVSLATDVIRINGPDGATEHNIDSLPLVYDTAALGGWLNICDGAGKMVYCRRSAVSGDAAIDALGCFSGKSRSFFFHVTGTNFADGDDHTEFWPYFCLVWPARKKSQHLCA